jgi:hypothetical protein
MASGDWNDMVMSRSVRLLVLELFDSFKPERVNVSKMKRNNLGGLGSLISTLTYPAFFTHHGV